MLRILATCSLLGAALAIPACNETDKGQPPPEELARRRYPDHLAELRSVLVLTPDPIVVKTVSTALATEPITTPCESGFAYQLRHEGQGTVFLSNRGVVSKHITRLAVLGLPNGWFFNGTCLAPSTAGPIDVGTLDTNVTLAPGMTCSVTLRMHYESTCTERYLECDIQAELDAFFKKYPAFGPALHQDEWNELQQKLRGPPYLTTECTYEPAPPDPEPVLEVYEGTELIGAWGIVIVPF